MLLHLRHGEQHAAPVVLTGPHLHREVAAGDAARDFGGIGGFAAQSALHVADDEGHGQRHHAAHDQDDDQVGGQRMDIGRVHFLQEHRAGNVPVPRGEALDVADLGQGRIAARLTALVFGKAVAFVLGGIDDGRVDRFSGRVLELGGALADHVGQRRVHLQDQLRIHHEQVARGAVAHRRQRREGGLLGLVLTHGAGLYLRVIQLGDALGGIHQVLQARLALIQHGGAGFHRTPDAHADQAQPHQGQRQSQFGFECPRSHVGRSPLVLPTWASPVRCNGGRPAIL